MKNIICLAIILLIAGCDRSAGEKNSTVDTVDHIQEKVESYAYDSAYAQALGADEYGMKTYVMAFLKRGPNLNQDSTTAANLQRAHLQNISRMAEEGNLIVAGPFLDDGEIRGIYIFNVESVEEARKLTETDPAIKAGRLTMELHPWYGPAVLQETLNLSKKATKTTF